MKCPYCNEELEEMLRNSKILGCPKCKYIADIFLWKELDCTRKALDVAVDVLKDISLQANFRQMLDAYVIRYKCEHAINRIKRITALEQKEEK